MYITIYNLYFNLKQLFISPTLCIDGFHMPVKTNSDYICKQH